MKKEMRTLFAIFGVAMLSIATLTIEAQLWVVTYSSPCESEIRTVNPIEAPDGSVFSIRYIDCTTEIHSQNGTTVVEITPLDGYDLTTALLLSKHDESGNLIWHKLMRLGINSSPQYALRPSDIAADNEGNLYLAGSYRGDLDLDPGEGVFVPEFDNLDNKSFLIKLDSEGNLLWEYTFEVGPSSGMKSINVQDDYLVCTGFFNNEMDLSDEIQFSGAGDDVFIIKFDFDGNPLWSNIISGVESENLDGDQLGYSTKVNPEGWIYLLGIYDQGLQVEIAGEPFTIVTNTNSNLPFIACLNPEGEFQWVYSMDNPEMSAYPYNMTLDDSGNLYTSGVFFGEQDFDFSSEVVNFEANGNDVYLVSLDSMGQLRWAHTFVSPNSVSNNHGRTVFYNSLNNTIVVAMVTQENDLLLDGDTPMNLNLGEGIHTVLITFNTSGDLISTAHFDTSAIFVREGNGRFLFTGLYEGDADFAAGEPEVIYSNENEASYIMSTSDTSLGIAEESGLKSILECPFSLSQNGGGVVIHATPEWLGAEATIFSMDGKQVDQFTIQHTNSELTSQRNVGVYFLHLKKENQQCVSKYFVGR